MSGVDNCTECGAYLGEPSDHWFLDRSVDNYCPGCAGGVVDHLKAENARLADLLRWREWPGEKPEKSGLYLVFRKHPGKDAFSIQHSLFDPEVNQFDGRVFYWCVSSVDYWRPIGPLPGGKAE